MTYKIKGWSTLALSLFLNHLDSESVTTI